MIFRVVRCAVGALSAVVLSACGDGEAAQHPEAQQREVAAPTRTPGAAADTDGSDIDRRAAQLLNQETARSSKSKFAPCDDCATVPGAKEFRLALAQAVLLRDADAVAAMASKDIQLSFGGDNGRTLFLADLKAGNGETFLELEKVLALGCAVMDDGELAMPWFFAQDIGDIDPFEVLLTTGSAVPLHRSGDPASPVMRTLSWALVELLSGFEDATPMMEVSTQDGVKGFIEKKHLRSPIDYRLIATRHGKDWKIDAFVSGD